VTSLQALAFAVLSVPAVVLSLPSLRQPRSHGFARFFGFEGTLLLVVANAGAWFTAPLTPVHVLSWVLLASSIGLAIHAYHQLRSRGRPSAGLETTTTLVTNGAFRYIRHPLYASLLLLATGAYLKAPRLWTSLVLVLTYIAFTFTAIAEEHEAQARFGAAYSDYMRHTRRFFPFIF